MKQCKCSVCGYVHDNEEAPEFCPLCKAPKEKFFAMEEGAVEGDVEKGAPAPPEEVREVPRSLFEKLSDLASEKHLHPISVHGPNGIVPVVVGFVVLSLLLESASLASAAYFNLIAVLLGMPLVLASGYLTWQVKYKGAKTSVFKIKIAGSSAATVILIGLVTWKTIQPDVLAVASLNRWLFLLWSLILLGLMGMVGHLGGQLAFGAKKG